MDFRLNHLDSLHWLWVVAGLLAVIVVGFALKRRDLARFADEGLLERLLPRTSPARQHVRAALLNISECRDVST